MSEAEILALSFSANEAVASLFSIFFGMVSAYIAGLFFFLNRAPFTLRFIAFVLLTLGFVFIGQAMSGIELRILGLVAAWDQLPATVSGIERLNNPLLPTPMRDVLQARGIVMPTYQGDRLGIYIGWALSVFVYLALFHATFLYRWPETRR